jgi:curved DNA-binding protein CbpA
LGQGHGAKSVEEMFEQAQRQIHERARQAEPRPRRKNARGEAAAARREQAAKEASQSIREVYRKLASALHPDRESDPTQRQAKTALMQRANRAYEAGDLLDLLNLQLEIEQIDADHLANLPEQRRAHYTQVLRDQVAELDKEIETLVAPFRMIVMALPHIPLTPEAVDRSLDGEIARLGRDEAETRADMEGFRDPRERARMLKTYEPDDENAEELAEMLELAALFEQLGGHPGPGRGKPAGGKRKKKPRRS